MDLAMLIVTADDLGRSVAETDAALKCFRANRISSASLMVFMTDSERATSLARKTNLDVGLHLNFTEPFTGACSSRVIESQHRLATFLRRNRYAQLVYNPALRNHFARSCRAQLSEFARLFDGALPSHVNGHHHMHLCANMLFSRLIPARTKMRRNFSFWPGEKSGANRFYRAAVDQWLSRRYRLPQFFFDLLQSLEYRRLGRALALARTATVEIMTHPIVATECEFLMSGTFVRALRTLDIGAYRNL